MVDAAHSDYVAREPARESDLNFPFLEFMWKHASWPDIVPRINGLAEDVHNLAASLAKIDHFFKYREQVGHGVTRFVETEVEYMFTVCRSLFDLLQEIVAAVWQRVRLLDDETQAKKRELPKSFRKMVIYDTKLMDVEEIGAKFHIPAALAGFYAHFAPFFEKLRSYRDGVVHGLAGQTSLYSTEKGFGVDRRRGPLHSFFAWEEADLFNENVASLRPVLASLVFDTIYACNAFADVVKTNIVFPKDLAPGYKFFTRSYHNEALLAAQLVYRREAGPWWTATKD